MFASLRARLICATRAGLISTSDREPGKFTERYSNIDATLKMFLSHIPEILCSFKLSLGYNFRSGGPPESTFITREGLLVCMRHEYMLCAELWCGLHDLPANNTCCNLVDVFVNAKAVG